MHHHLLDITRIGLVEQKESRKGLDRADTSIAGKPTGRIRWLSNPPTGPKQWGHWRKITSSTAEYKLDVLAAHNKDFGEGKTSDG